MSGIATTKAGTIDQARRTIRIGLSLWATAIVILCAGIMWFGIPAMFEPNSPDFIPIADFFAFAFAAFGTIHLGQGLIQVARHGKYGASTLVAGPAVLGQSYRGKILTDRAIEVSGPYTIRLVCETQAASTGDDDARSQKGRSPIWQAEITAPASTPSSTGIPFQFRIPADGLPNRSGSSVPGYAIFWTLSVTAPMSGLHYRATFPISVGATADSSDDDDEDRPLGPRTLAAAFTGEAKPERPRMGVIRFVVPIVGLLLSAAGVYGTAIQWSHGRDGISVTGRITSINAPMVDVALDGSGAIVRVARVTKNNTWQTGQSVQLTCLRDGGGMRSCRMDTGADRWIDGVGTLAVGLILLFVGGWFWFRRLMQ